MSVKSAQVVLFIGTPCISFLKSTKATQKVKVPYASLREMCNDHKNYFSNIYIPISMKPDGENL